MQNDGTTIAPIVCDPRSYKTSVRIPAGLCPIKFSHFWDLDGCCPPDTVITAWFWEVREYGLRRGEYYTADAIAYWVRSEFDPLTEADTNRHIKSVIIEYAIAIGDHLAPAAETPDESLGKT